MKKVFLPLIICVLYLTTAQSQGFDRSLFIKDSLDSYVNRALTNWRIPGMAICVVKDGSVVLMKGFGTKELGVPGGIDENTLFMIGSNTKAFTATAMALLEASNRLSLDDKVTEYIPSFKLDNIAAGEQTIITDLLTHRLGFKTFQGDFSFYNTDLSRQHILERMAKMKAPYPFRTKWGYTNSAYMVAGEIIPKVTGRPWEVYLKDNIFAPLGMINTLTLTKDMPSSLNRTVPHTLVDGRLTAIPYAQLDNMAAAMGMSSSINDMSKWVMALMNDGKVGPKQVIPAAAINATLKPQEIVGTVTYPNGETNYKLYGLGWYLQDYAGRHLAMHDGAVNGYLSSVTLVPQEKLGIVILTNTDKNELYEALRWQILDAYFKQPYRNYSDIALGKFKANEAKQMQANKQLRDSVVLNPMPAMPIANYTGKYVNDLYGSMNITRGELNNLEMRFEHHPKMYVLLQPLGGNRFYATFSDPIYGKTVIAFTFQGGRITGVRVMVDDMVERDPYEFKKTD
jgi:CubicO group peptidase (beta-lactamase class C family)